MVLCGTSVPKSSILVSFLFRGDVRLRPMTFISPGVATAATVVVVGPSLSSASLACAEPAIAPSTSNVPLPIVFNPPVSPTNSTDEVVVAASPAPVPVLVASPSLRRVNETDPVHTLLVESSPALTFPVPFVVPAPDPETKCRSLRDRSLPRRRFTHSAFPRMESMRSDADEEGGIMTENSLTHVPSS